MLEESGFPSFAIHVFTHVMREADELFEINSKLLLEFLELDKARYFTKGTTGWTHIEDFITCRIDAELKNTHLLHEKEEKYFHPHPLLGLTFMNWIKRINRLTNRLAEILKPCNPDHQSRS